jgi:hypothetical protein
VFDDESEESDKEMDWDSLNLTGQVTETTISEWDQSTRYRVIFTNGFTNEEYTLSARDHMIKL